MRQLGKLGLACLTAALASACTDDAPQSQDTTPATEPSLGTAPASTEPVRESDGVLTIGVLLPRTGSGATIGGPGITAAEEAVRAINETGVFDESVVLVRQDEGETIEQAREGVAQLLAADVDAVVGPASSIVALDVLDDLMDAGVVTCSPTASSIALDDYPNRDLFFRTIPSNSLVAIGLAAQAERTGVDAVTLVYSDDEFGRPFAAAVTESLEARNLTVNEPVLLRPDVDLVDQSRALADTETGTIILIADAATGWAMLSELSATLDDPPNIIVNDALRDSQFAPQVAVLPETFRNAIEGVSPGGTPQFEAEPVGAFATNTLDCVNVIALGAVASGSDDPVAIAAEIPQVSRGGVQCASFADCAEQIRQGSNIDYQGPRNRFTMNQRGDLSTASLMLFRFNDSGLAEDAGPLGVTE